MLSYHIVTHITLTLHIVIFHATNKEQKLDCTQPPALQRPSKLHFNGLIYTKKIKLRFQVTNIKYGRNAIQMQSKMRVFKRFSTVRPRVQSTPHAGVEGIFRPQLNRSERHTSTQKKRSEKLKRKPHKKSLSSDILIPPREGGL